MKFRVGEDEEGQKRDIQGTSTGAKIRKNGQLELSVTPHRYVKVANKKAEMLYRLYSVEVSSITNSAAGGWSWESRTDAERRGREGLLSTNSCLAKFSHANATSFRYLTQSIKRPV